MFFPLVGKSFSSSKNLSLLHGVQYDIVISLVSVVITPSSFTNTDFCFCSSPIELSYRYFIFINSCFYCLWLSLLSSLSTQVLPPCPLGPPLFRWFSCSECPRAHSPPGIVVSLLLHTVLHDHTGRGWGHLGSGDRQVTHSSSGNSRPLPPSPTGLGAVLSSTEALC